MVHVVPVSNPHFYMDDKMSGVEVYPVFILCFPEGYREIAVKIFFYLTLVPPVKISIFMFLLSRLIAHASQPDGNITSFTLHFSHFDVIL